MHAVAVVELSTRTGVPAGALTVWPGRAPKDSAAHPSETSSTALVVETREYRFEATVPGATVVAVTPEELFDGDTGPPRSDGGLGGRLRTGNAVGQVEVVVSLDDGAHLTGWLEIHSAKLGHENQYRWMLSGVAEDGAALLLRAFGPSTIGLVADHRTSTQTRYQQLAFLAAILRRPHTVEAFERVLRSPHVTYIDITVEQPVGRGIPGSSRSVRSLAGAGRRLPAPPGLVVTSVPERVSDARTVATIDAPANQFVRFVLDYWASVLADLDSLLDEATPEGRRGRREVRELSDRVDRWRSDPRFRDVGSLHQVPSGDSVLLRKPGYREIHQVFLESVAAGMLRWDAVDDVNRAGLRDIAQLYEYWCYLELRRLVEQVCDYADSTSLVEPSADGLHLGLRRGRTCVVSGFLSRNGRQVDVDLWFNKNFTEGRESWSVQMRPDCSLRFSAQSGDGTSVETWVHFDAKYRVERADELFVDEDSPVPARRDDLLKMHAYRDAIRGTGGSYVLYPGDQNRTIKQRSEVLPGIGALPFVPGSDGHATSTSKGDVLSLLDELVDHVADQASRRERALWWEEATQQVPDHPRTPFVPLRRPPADTRVLLGYYRSPEHLAWIERHRLYNLRFGGRRGSVELTGAEASAELLVLWTAEDSRVRCWWLTEELALHDASSLEAMDYPGQPTGQYLCRHLAEPFDVLGRLHRDDVAALSAVAATGAPLSLTWLELSEALEVSR